MDQPALRERVLRLLISGELPKTVPDWCLGGPGSGRDCQVCLESIATSALEVEVDNLAFHPNCYLLWVEAVRGLAS